MNKGPVAYMAKNHVAANILMLILLVGGLFIGSKIKQEVFPEFDLDMISISVLYPGATPEEVEDAIVRPVELAVNGLDNVKRIRGSAQENIGSVIIEVVEGENADLVLQDAKSEVDRITTFPEEVEKPVISKLSTRQEVITLLVFGDVSERALLENSELIRDELQAMPSISQVEIGGYRPYEISIEISEENLRKYNLRLTDAADAIRRSSLDLAGGTIMAESGDILIRTTEKRYTGADFDSVTVKTLANGQRLLLKDIGAVIDGFEEIDQRSFFDDRPAVLIKVFRIGDQTPKDISGIVRAYIDNKKGSLPPSIDIAVWTDWSIILDQRINLLLRNGFLGLLLVLMTLSFFLEMRLAMMVAAGIAISFLGSLMFLPGMDVTINMISLFAFLIILGMVVDDAIVIGENIFVHIRRGKPLLQAAIDGAREVSMAVIFAGLTTVAAFGPLLFVGGLTGKFMGVLPKIVITVLIISLVEALFILPSHLASKTISGKSAFWSRIEAFRSRFDKLIDWLINKSYFNTLKWALQNRITTIATAIAILIASIGLITGGYIKFVMMPEVEADWVDVTLNMAPGTPFSETERQALYIQSVGKKLIDRYDAERKDGISNMRHMYTLIGQQIREGGHNVLTVNGSNLAQIQILLEEPDIRKINTGEFAREWRDLAGEIPGAESVNFVSDMMMAGADIAIELSHIDFNQLIPAVEKVKDVLRGYDGVSEVADSYVDGKKELKMTLKPEAASLGITEFDLASQVRAAFYGAEALRIQRGQNEVKIMVRYPEEDRRKLASIEKMRLRTPDGREIPLLDAAYVEEGRGFNEITRTDRRRVVTVTADVNPKIANSTEVLADMQKGILDRLKAEYPGLSYDLEGTSRDQKESFTSLAQALLFGMILIYALLAVPFKSFLQPLIVMSAIPFGIIGALIGHLLMGFDISMISLFGIVALSGVVVNSSLVMIDFINRYRTDNSSLEGAVIEAGLRRFRPIIMTALTTFFGLTPMIFETEIQAQFLAPMAVSLGFGVLFATAITLILVPTMYMLLEDSKKFAANNGLLQETAMESEAL